MTTRIDWNRAELYRQVDNAKSDYIADGCNGAVKLSRAAYRFIHTDFRSEDESNPRCLVLIPGSGTCLVPVEFTDL